MSHNTSSNKEIRGVFADLRNRGNHVFVPTNCEDKGKRERVELVEGRTVTRALVPGQIATISGGVEIGQTSRTTMQNELWEEVGLHIELQELLPMMLVLYAEQWGRNGNQQKTTIKGQGFQVQLSDPQLRQLEKNTEVTIVPPQQLRKFLEKNHAEMRPFLLLLICKMLPQQNFSAVPMLRLLENDNFYA